MSTVAQQRLSRKNGLGLVVKCNLLQVYSHQHKESLRTTECGDRETGKHVCGERSESSVKRAK